MLAHDPELEGSWFANEFPARGTLLDLPQLVHLQSHPVGSYECMVRPYCTRGGIWIKAWITFPFSIAHVTGCFVWPSILGRILDCHARACAFLALDFRHVVFTSLGLYSSQKPSSGVLGDSGESSLIHQSFSTSYHLQVLQDSMIISLFHRTCSSLFLPSTMVLPSTCNDPRI